MKALADGLAVSLAIERYLKTGGMNEPFRKEGTLLSLQHEWDRACRSGGSGKRGIVYGGRGDAGDHALPEVFV